MVGRSPVGGNGGASLIKNTPWAATHTIGVRERASISLFDINNERANEAEKRLLPVRLLGSPLLLVDSNHYNDPARYRLKFKTFLRRGREKGRI